MYKAILFFSLLLTCNLARAQEEWTLNSESDGIKVYNAKASASKIKPIKVECTFNATVTQVVAVLLDIKAYPAWVYHTKTAVLVKQVSPAELYYYTEVSVPWPGQNRDFVAHVTAIQNPDTKTVTIDAPTVTGFVPEKEGIYRLHTSNGKWIITPAGNQAKVVYFLQIDPGGSAPAWLINLFADEGPLQSFKKLKLQLQKSAYKNVFFPFIKN